MPDKSHKDYIPIIQEAKNKLKNSNTYKDLCDKFGLDYGIIDLIPVACIDLDVSGRTENGCIYINKKYADNLDQFAGYLTHEYSHCLEQLFGTGTYGSNDADDYLDNPFEIDAFKNQVEFIDENKGKEEAENYVEKVLDHHNVEDRERVEKKKQLMDKVAALFTIPQDILGPLATWVVQNVTMKTLYDCQQTMMSLTGEKYQQAWDLFNVLSKYTAVGSPNKKDQITIPTLYFSTIEKWGIEPELVNQLIESGKWPKEIPILLFLDAETAPKSLFNGPDQRGGFNVNEKYIYILAETEKINNKNTLDFALQEVISILRHEIQHLYQKMLTDIKDLSYYKLLPKKLRKDPSIDFAKDVFNAMKEVEVGRRIEKLKILHKKKEHLLDHEFYTYLEDAIDLFKKEVNAYKIFYSPELKKEFTRAFIGEPNRFKEVYKETFNIVPGSPFYESFCQKLDAAEKPFPLFETFKLYHPDKYKKAIKEFYKAINFA